MLQVHRLRRLLAAAGELCVCELAPLVDGPSSAVGHAPSELAHAGLVDRRTEGTWRYVPTTHRAERPVDALDETRGETS